MITVPEATKKIIERSRYLSEAISKRLINYSSLARYMKPEIEQMLIKEVSVSSIMMALKRLEPKLKPNYHYVNIFKTKPEIILRSNLVMFVLRKDIKSFDSSEFVLKNKGTKEVSYILTQDFFETLKIENNDIVFFIPNLCAVSIKLPEEALKTSGIYYFFLKSLAWEGINIIELSSTPNEFTIVVEEKDVEITFNIINALFSKNS